MGKRGYILYLTFVTSVVLVFLGLPFVGAKQVGIPPVNVLERGTEEPRHIPVGRPLEGTLERGTEEPPHIPVSIVEDTDESAELDLLEFEAATSNIEWPVRIPGKEERQQLERQAQDQVSGSLFELDDRIVKGKQVQITERPFQVYIGGCGGSLISPNWVLTAAHCITNENGYHQMVWKVRAGSNDRTQGFKYRDVYANAIKVHPSWFGDVNQHGSVDLALMYIKTPFQESNSIKTIAINDRYANLEGKTATVSGWGHTHAEYAPTILSQTTLRIQYDKMIIGMAVLRMPNAQGSGICQGDSGGPATVRDNNGNTLLVGVASYVLKECGPNINDGKGTYTDDSANYVDINKYVDWIRQTINQGGSAPATTPATTCSNINATGYCVGDNVDKSLCNWDWFRDDCKQLCNAC